MHAQAFSSPSLPTKTRINTSLNAQQQIRRNDSSQSLQKSLASLTVAGALAFSALQPIAPATAYEDYSGMDDVDTVANVVQSLKDSSGDTAASFKAFESINEIITEGKGVGGMISSSGVKLERGFVADEDTTIYNPGLTLLTESEKTKIVDAIIQNRKENISKKSWNSDNEFAYESLKARLDPLHMAELKGYLGILPFYGAAVYLLSLGVQQFARDLFSGAYIVSALAVFFPIAVLILKGQ